ncbi:MAG: 4-hydroxyphenylpyruvate dioxygenase [Prochloraceae cyanobacterium]|nr:4-hydroxyphenylpyruvate dioxygenase [Prochloraceae cyanobacterium]
MYVDRVHFYVEDAKKWRNWFIKTMGFDSIASGSDRHTRVEAVSSGGVILVISSPLAESSPVAEYLRFHPPGVSDLAFCVTDIESIMSAAIATGAKIEQPIEEKLFPQGQLKWSKITSIASISHTLVERKGITPLLPEEWIEHKQLSPKQSVNFTGIDHIVLNVPTGDLKNTVSWYEAALGFVRKQDFTIETERSGLYSQVMVHPLTGMQFPVNEPISANSQIQEFLDLNKGAGIQHMALSTSQILEVTKKLRAAGLSFLSVPQTYYTELQQKYPYLSLSESEWQQIIDREILVDYQQETASSIPLLLQTFTQPIFAQPTFFFELIERRFQARGFGEGNFRALFEAIEREQIKRSTSK